MFRERFSRPEVELFVQGALIAEGRGLVITDFDSGKCFLKSIRIPSFNAEILFADRLIIKECQKNEFDSRAGLRIWRDCSFARINSYFTFNEWLILEDIEIESKMWFCLQEDLK